MEKIHDLVKLLGDAVKYEPGLEEFEDACRIMSEYYFESRYPGRPCAEYKREIIEESLNATERIISLIRRVTKP